MENVKENLQLISRDKLQDFYKIVREDYMKDKKALSNKVIDYIGNMEDYQWENLLNKLPGEFLEMNKYEVMVNRLNNKLFAIWFGKERISEEYLGHLFFAQSYWSGGKAQSQYKKAQELNLYCSTNNEHDFVYEYAIKTGKLFYLLSMDNKELAYSGINKIEKSLNNYNELMEYIEKWETQDKLSEKDNEGMDVIQRMISSDNAGMVFESEMVLKILLRNKYNFFQSDLSFYEKMTNEEYKKRVEEDPCQKTYFALYEKENLKKMIDVSPVVNRQTRL